MKFVFINGSPRKDGNTQYALKMLLQGFQERFSSEQMELINVTDYNINGCIHCDKCRENGCQCVLKDDGNRFSDMIIDADIIVFATPVYWWGICGQLKTAIDRLYAKSDVIHGGKKIGIISVGADSLDSPQYDLIYRQFVCICDYMEWDLSYVKAITASGPHDVRKDKELCDKLKLDWKNFILS